MKEVYYYLKLNQINLDLNFALKRITYPYYFASEVFDNAQHMLTLSMSHSMPNTTFLSMSLTTHPNIIEPKTIKAALSKPHRLSIMYNKLQTLRTNDIWTLVLPKRTMNVVDT